MKALKICFVSILICLLSLVLLLLLTVSQGIYHNPKIMVQSSFDTIAHRGGFIDISPENSAAAIRQSLLHRIKNIEIDVQQTKDSIIVLMHDKSVNRTTNGTGLVKNMTYQELSVLYFKTDKLEKIPRLEDVIDLVNGRANLFIEIKAGSDLYPGIEERIIKTINLKNAYSWCIIHSFNDEILDKVHKLDYKIRLQKTMICKIRLLPIIIDNKIHFKKMTDYNFVEGFNINYIFANKEIIKKIHSLKKRVNVWTLNRNKERFLNLGIDGIITDYPIN